MENIPLLRIIGGVGVVIGREYTMDFLLGGKCECAIGNYVSGNEYAYKLQYEGDGNPIFVHVRRNGSYTYAGFLRNNNDIFTFSTGVKGKLSSDDVEIKALLYVLNNISKLPEKVYVRHFGKCSRCGRALTDDTSLMRGLGPSCYQKVMG